MYMMNKCNDVRYKYGCNKIGSFQLFGNEYLKTLTREATYDKCTMERS